MRSCERLISRMPRIIQQTLGVEGYRWEKGVWASKLDDYAMGGVGEMLCPLVGRNERIFLRNFRNYRWLYTTDGDYMGNALKLVGCTAIDVASLMVSYTVGWKTFEASNNILLALAIGFATKIAYNMAVHGILNSTIDQR